MTRLAASTALTCLVVLLMACSSGAGTPAPGGSSAPLVPSGPVQVVTSTATATAAVPANIPIMPGATDLRVSESDIYFVIKSDLQGVIDYYEKEMPARGWKEQDKSPIIGDFGRLYFSDPEHQVSMQLTSSPTLNQVVIRMSLIYLNVVETPKPK